MIKKPVIRSDHYDFDEFAQLLHNFAIKKYVNTERMKHKDQVRYPKYPFEDIGFGLDRKSKKEIWTAAEIIYRYCQFPIVYEALYKLLDSRDELTSLMGMTKDEILATATNYEVIKIKRAKISKLKNAYNIVFVFKYKKYELEVEIRAKLGPTFEYFVKKVNLNIKEGGEQD